MVRRGLWKLTVVLSILGLLGSSQQVRASHEWWPDSTGEPQLNHAWDDGYGQWWNYGQAFMWSQHNLDTFFTKNAYFQFEIRRLSEFWEFWHCGTGQYYWTDLPNPNLTYSEENDPPVCYWDKAGDEEFQIKAESLSLQANYWYSGYGYFTWDNEDLNGWKNLQTEAEYCGFPGPGCDGNRFAYVVLTSGSVCNSNC